MRKMPKLMMIFKNSPKIDNNRTELRGSKNNLLFLKKIELIQKYILLLKINNWLGVMGT